MACSPKDFCAAVSEPVAGGRIGGVAGAAADPLHQAGQFGCQGGKLAGQLIDLLPKRLNLLLLSEISVLTLAGVASQSASGIPAGGVFITGGLCLRCNRESS